jgi:hypothetical protein
VVRTDVLTVPDVPPRLDQGSTDRRYKYSVHTEAGRRKIKYKSINTRMSELQKK